MSVAMPTQRASLGEQPFRVACKRKLSLPSLAHQKVRPLVFMKLASVNVNIGSRA